MANGALTRRAFLAIGLAGAGSLLAACQQPTTPSRSADPRPPELRTPEPKPIPIPAATTRPGSQAAPAPGAPKPGGSLVWAAELDPLDLDPRTSAHVASIQAWGDLTYQSLVMFDENLKIMPCLAEAWQVSDDRLTWKFKLRQGVRFHDGSEFEAEDVRFWFDRTMAPETAAPYKGSFSQITRVEPKGKYTVEFTLGAPYAPFLGTFAALRGSAMVPRRWMQGAGAAAKSSAVGSGPFKIAEYVPRSHIRYVRHRDYWEQGLPYLDDVTFKIVTDEEQRVAALRSGQVKYAAVGPQAAQQLKRELTVLVSAGPVQRVTSLNVLRKPFDDVRVRQAIGLTVDRTAAIEKVLGGEGRLTGPMPTGHGDWPIPPERLPYRKDLAIAQHLLAEAGYPDGFGATIKAPSDSPSLLSTATLLADQVRAVGITLHVEQLEGRALLEAVDANDVDLHMSGIGFLPDPDGYFSPYSSRGRSPGTPSLTPWANARYDEIVEHARSVLDPGDRKRLYDEAAAIVMHEAPLIWWFTENTLEVIHASVKGYRQSFTGRRLGLKKTWLDG
jgi:peptide/nickel transport system substrate-binding protein